MKTRVATSRSEVGSHTQLKVDTQVSKVTMTGLAIAACCIGVWALASIIGGVAESGGPIALVADWIKAVSGK